jgi:ElaB/YqjD/DUF883 family membrane-anchored ribosome-binding protein
MGILVSTIVDSPDKAIALVPILLIPQVLFSGIFGELRDVQQPIGELMISKWSYNLMKKQFELPTHSYRIQLEHNIDDRQEEMKDITDDINNLQEQLRATLKEMETKVYPAELQELREKSNRLLSQLNRDQDQLESARNKIEKTEIELRAKAKYFVWVDRPNSTNIDWIVLCFFSIVFLLLSYLQLKRKDKLLLAL